ncbi:MAG TPA: hypothetical protein VGM56_23780, partial [Byssovorax sp.]
MDPALEGAEPGRAPQQERLGGARADFVATLGRRVAELQAALLQLSQEPRSARAQGDLLRRVHALAASAKLLRFTKLADALTGRESELEAAASLDQVDDDVLRV